MSDEMIGHGTLLELTSDIVAGAIPEHAAVVLGGVSYTIGKIDGIGGGMSVLYLEP